MKRNSSKQSRPIGFFARVKESIERYIPMTLGSLLLFSLVVYFGYIVGKTSWDNYQANKSISIEELQVQELEKKLEYMQYEINYYNTYSFKEKEAREKLGYKSPGEKMMSLPYDTPLDAVADAAPGEVVIKVPNYINWWDYFFKKQSTKINGPGN